MYAWTTEDARLTAAERSIRLVMRPGVVTMPDDASLLQVQRAMLSHDVHAILIVSRVGSLPIGWVTARGLLSFVHDGLAGSPARDAVTEDAVRIDPGLSVAEGIRVLRERGVSHLLVASTPGGPPLGVVTDLDLVRAFAPS